MKVYICEKPSLARALFEGLGGDVKRDKKNGHYQVGDHCVTYCVGHMLELLDPEDFDKKYEQWNMEDLPFKFPYKLKEKKDVLEQYKIIVSLLKKATTIINVGDPDEEGQLLVDEILHHENINKSIPVKRILIADYNQEAVKKSIANIFDNSEWKNQGKCALARSISDQLFGYNLTRAYTLGARKKGYSGVLNVGRVQTAIVNLIRERQRAVEEHKESFYYNTYAASDINNVSFVAKYLPRDSDPVDENGRILNIDFAQSICEKVKGQPSTILSAKHSNSKRNAPYPYTLATLQADCGRKFRMSALDVLDAAQSLYEKHKVLTYPRSNCKYLGDESFNERKKVLNAIANTCNVFKNHIGGATNNKPHPCFNSKKVGAHHAIVPTSTAVNFDQLTDNEQKIYKLVARSYIALIYPHSEYKVSNVITEIADLQFGVKSEAKVIDGWEKLYASDSDNPDIEETSEVNTVLSSLKDGQTGVCLDATTDKKAAPAPKYFVGSTLLRTLTNVASEINDPELRESMVQFFKEKGEKAELGTETTRAGIIEKVIKSGLCETVKEKGYKEDVFKMTDIGKQFIDILPDNCKTVDNTARWVKMGIDVKNGSMSVDQYVDEVFKMITNEVENTKSNGFDIELNLEKCPICDSGLLRPIKSAKGTFFGCTNHPDCKVTFPEYKGKVYTQSHDCPKCSKPLVLRKTSGDYWFGCTGYEQGCRETLGCVGGKPAKKTRARKGTQRAKRKAS